MSGLSSLVAVTVTWYADWLALLGSSEVSQKILVSRVIGSNCVKLSQPVAVTAEKSTLYTNGHFSVEMSGKVKDRASSVIVYSTSGSGP